MKTVVLFLIPCLSMQVFTIILSRKLHVRIENYQEAELDSVGGVHHYSQCAKRCHRITGCAAIAYNSQNNECTTYSEKFTEDEDDSTNIISSTMYFSKIEQGCGDVYMENRSDVYRIHTPQGRTIDVFCDGDTAGGPWTIIHNRQAGDVDFHRNWTEFKTGFGDLHGDFWLGNDNIHALTQQVCTLRIEMETFDGTVGFAEYSSFQIADESDKYRISVTGYSGNHGDSLTRQNGQQFSTFDQDNDIWGGTCAGYFNAAWWFQACADSSLNGPITSNPTGDVRESMNWRRFFSQSDTSFIYLKKARMMIKTNIM